METDFFFFNGVSQLISDSLKAKQLQTSLHAEKQELNVRIQHANISADKYKQRIVRLEEQVSPWTHSVCIVLISLSFFDITRVHIMKFQHMKPCFI